MKIKTAYFNRFVLNLSQKCVEDCSHPGDCDEGVSFWVNQTEIKSQLEEIGPDNIRKELKEYGAWDYIELGDENQNNKRILWIAAGNIKESGK